MNIVFLLVQLDLMSDNVSADVHNNLNKKLALKTMHTKVLLSRLNDLRHASGWDIFTSEELKEELAKREHIPNKKEAKLIRQLKAKRRR